jgi:hypothetical protein
MKEDEGLREVVGLFCRNSRCSIFVEIIVKGVQSLQSNNQFTSDETVQLVQTVHIR